MKLPIPVYDLFIRCIDVASRLSIDDISIEDSDKGKMIRGLSTVNGTPVLIYHPLPTTDLPFKSFAIINCKMLQAKLKFAKSKDDGFDMDVTIDESSRDVTGVLFKGKRFKLQFNPGRSTSVKAPKGIKDTVKSAFILESTDCDTIIQATQAMGAEFITLICDGSHVAIEIRTGGKDCFEYAVDQPIVKVSEELDYTYTHSYNVKTLNPILKACDDGVFSVTQRGVVTCRMNGIDVWCVPRV